MISSNLARHLLKSELISLNLAQIHWAREVPRDLKDVVEVYLFNPRAEKYRQMDRDKNGGNLPERTVISENVCFCLIRPTYDQCADPTYTQLRANLPVWHKQRGLKHEQSRCDVSCKCLSAPWFRSISSSEEALNEGLLCQPIACPELQVEDDHGQTPKLNKPSCARGECDHPGARELLVDHGSNV